MSTITTVPPVVTPTVSASTTPETHQALDAALVDVKKDVENDGHSFIHTVLAYLKTKCAAAGTDLATELKKI